MSGEGPRVTVRKKAGRATKMHGGTGVGSFREKLDWAWLCARVRGAGVPESDVDDVAQVVLIAMSRAEKKLAVREGQTVREARRAMMRKIIRFRVADYKRDKARFYRMRLKLAWSDSRTVEPSVETRVLEKERHTQLHAALEALKQMARCYEVVILNGLEEMPMREVVATLGIPDGTARDRMLRGKQALRQALEREARREKSAA